MAVGTRNALLASLWAQETGAQAGTDGITKTVTVENEGSWACKTLRTPGDLLCRLPQTSERHGRPCPCRQHTAAFSVLCGMFSVWYCVTVDSSGLE